MNEQQSEQNTATKPANILVDIASHFYSPLSLA